MDLFPISPRKCVLEPITLFSERIQVDPNLLVVKRSRRLLNGSYQSAVDIKPEAH